LFELPEDTSRPDNEHYVEVEDVPGYSPAYSQLISVKKPVFDPLTGTYAFLSDNRPILFGLKVGA